MSLKRDKRELELKNQEQEEELDEQAGQIQILQQVRFFAINHFRSSSAKKLTKENTA